MTDLARVREHLEERLATLEVRTERIQADLGRLAHPDSAERAQEAENDEVLERLGEAERGEIEQLRRAIGRLDAGVYERCEGCGREIGAARLEALPTATRCLACAA